MGRLVFSLAATLVGCAIGGCASSSEIVSTGDGLFIVSRQANNGFSEIGEMRKELLIEASRFCSSKQKDLRITGLRQTPPPYSTDNAPYVELTFACDHPR